MNKDMAQLHYPIPICFRMILAKGFGQMKGCFTNNFYVFHYCIIQYITNPKVATSFAFSKFENFIDSINNMFQSGTVFKRLSHKSKFYHD